MVRKQTKRVETSDTTIRQLASVFPISVESLRGREESEGARVIIREFGLNTSAHGIPGIARSQNVCNRIFWSISFVIFTGITFYFIIQAVRLYFQYPTQTSVEFNDQWPQPFPAVTICNYSPFRSDQFLQPYLNYTNKRNLTNRNNTKEFSYEDSLYINDFIQYKLNRNESLDEYYFPLQSMLIKCIYNGQNCSYKDFIPFESPTYGLCSTFNSQSKSTNNGQIHFNNENGFTGQLSFDIYVHSHQYIPYLSDGVGIVIMVHDNTRLPLIDRVGYLLEGGKKHKLGYSKKSNIFLPSPYTTCSDKVTPGMKVLFDQFSEGNYTYDQEICYKVALQTYTYEQCGCVSPFEWSIRYIIIPESSNIIYSDLCNVSDPCYSDAAHAFQSSELILSEYGANCGLECSSNEFIIKFSSISSPTPWLINSIKEFVQSSSIPLAENWSNTSSEQIKTNYVGINVVCETTRVESYIQQASMAPVDLISNVGGQTGLWIGISFLSIMELIEMIYKLLQHQFVTIYQKIRKYFTNKQQTDP